MFAKKCLLVSTVDCTLAKFSQIGFYKILFFKFQLIISWSEKLLPTCCCVWIYLCNNSTCCFNVKISAQCYLGLSFSAFPRSPDRWNSQQTGFTEKPGFVRLDLEWNIMKSDEIICNNVLTEQHTVPRIEYHHFHTNSTQDEASLPINRVENAAQSQKWAKIERSIVSRLAGLMPIQHLYQFISAFIYVQKQRSEILIRTKIK